ncbi:MAG: hypothetical protein ACJAVY_001932 [Marinoscillum sp.]|jgi:hypothetical protein
MKYLKLIIIMLICTSASAQVSKGALISVFGDRNLSDNPLDTKLYESIMKDSSFNLNPIVNKFDEAIRTILLPQFPFTFISKDEVVNADGYQDLQKLSRWPSNNWFTTSADQYVSIAAFALSEDTEAIKKSFDILPEGVDGVMIAFVSFNIYDAGGIGPLAKKKVYAYVNLKIFDKSGEKVFKLRERASSSDGVLAVGGFITDLSKLTPMIESASANLIADMETKLSKSLKKMAKDFE